MGGRKRGSAIKKTSARGLLTQARPGVPVSPTALQPGARRGGSRRRTVLRPRSAGSRHCRREELASVSLGGGWERRGAPHRPPSSFSSAPEGPQQSKTGAAPTGPTAALPSAVGRAAGAAPTRSPPVGNARPPLRSPFPPTALRRLGPAEGGGVAVGPGAAPPGSEGTPGANRAHRRPHDVGGLFCVPSLLEDGRWDGWVAAARCDLIWESPAAMET